MNNPNQPDPTIVEALKAALKPFAKAWNDAVSEHGDNPMRNNTVERDRAAINSLDAEDLRAADAALLRAEGESREGEHKEADAYLRALLDYSGGFYGACREAGLPAKTVVDAMAHIERAARNLHRLAVAQPHHPTASEPEPCPVCGGSRLEDNMAAGRNCVCKPTASVEPVGFGRLQSMFPRLHGRTVDLLNQFVVALAEKLMRAEEKYGYSDGWARDDWEEECRRALARHVQKGDPLDVAAYAAFCWKHMWPTTPSAPIPTEGHEQGVRGSEERAGLLETAVADLLFAYRAKYRGATGSIKQNSPPRDQMKALVSALGEVNALPLTESKPHD